MQRANLVPTLVNLYITIEDFFSFSGEVHSKHRRTVSSHHSISRAPSTHIGRVDEEPSSSKTRDAQVETVDRGVGPTPLPQLPPHVDTRLSPYSYPLPPGFLDPRNGLDQPSPYGLYFTFIHLVYLFLKAA